MLVIINLFHAFLAEVEVGHWSPGRPSVMLIAASATSQATWSNVPYAKVGAPNVTLTGGQSNVKDAPEMVGGSVPVVVGTVWCPGL